MKKNDAEKIKLYEEVLNDLAMWDESKLSHCDEPGAAKAAREVLDKTGADKYVRKLVTKSTYRRFRLEAV